MKHGTIGHPKMVELADRLQAPIYAAVGIMESIWHWASKYAPAGNIGKYSDAAIAKGIGWEGKAKDLIDAITNSGWLDVHPEHRLIVHDWPQHCEDSIHNALARKAELFADGSLPSLKRMSEQERKKIAELYLEKRGIDINNYVNVAHSAHSERTESAQKAQYHSLSPVLNSPVLPPLPPSGGSEALSASGGSGEEDKTNTPPPKMRNPPIETQWLMNLWNAEAHPSLSRIAAWTPARKKSARARIAEHPDPEDWRRAIQFINADPFHLGETSRDGWKANIDYLLRPNTLVKLLEKRAAEETCEAGESPPGAGRERWDDSLFEVELKNMLAVQNGQEGEVKP